jgi:hypothetical protein
MMSLSVRERTVRVSGIFLLCLSVTGFSEAGSPTTAPDAAPQATFRFKIPAGLLDSVLAAFEPLSG